MSLTNAIFRKSVFFFALLPIFAVWGFWITYFSAPSEMLSPHHHVHGIAMFGWCLMLIMQSFLIRKGRREIHRKTGKISYILVPVIIVSTVTLANYQLNVRELTPVGLAVLSFQVFLLIQFVAFYSLAIFNRNTPDVHARFMVCTALPLIDPIFARVIFFNFYQAPFETAIIQRITLKRRDVFLPALFIALATQLPIFFVLKWPAWEAFSGWFMRLPLS